MKIRKPNFTKLKFGLIKKRRRVTDNQIINGHQAYVLKHKRLPACADLAKIVKLAVATLHIRVREINRRRAKDDLPLLKFYDIRTHKVKKETDRRFNYAYIAHIVLHEKLPTLGDLGRSFNITRQRSLQILDRINNERKAKGLPPLETLRYAGVSEKKTKVTDEQIITAHQEHVRAHGKLPAIIYLSKKFGVTDPTIYTRLSQINKRRDAQGLPLLNLSIKERHRKVSDKQIIHAYLFFILLRKKLPFVADLSRALNITESSIHRRLRRINKERKAQGLRPLYTKGLAKKAYSTPSLDTLHLKSSSFSLEK